MVEHRADVLLALEAVEQYRIALHLGMRDFDRNRRTCIDVYSAKDRGHAAAGNQVIDAVIVEGIAGME
jgi:hypothetical protein